VRQPPLVPYQPPAWVDDAPVPPDPYGPAPSAPGTPGYGPPVGYPQAGYGQPPGYGTPPGYGSQAGWPAQPAWDAAFAPPPRQNGLALASMITSLGGIALCLFPGVVGLILGIVALQQIARDGTTGRGFAITGIAVGAASTLILVLAAITMWGSPA
jgi:hypothetical protein